MTRLSAYIRYVPVVDGKRVVCLGSISAICDPSEKLLVKGRPWLAFVSEHTHDSNIQHTYLCFR